MVIFYFHHSSPSLQWELYCKEALALFSNLFIHSIIYYINMDSHCLFYSLEYNPSLLDKWRVKGDLPCWVPRKKQDRWVRGGTKEHTGLFAGSFLLLWVLKQRLMDCLTEVMQRSFMPGITPWPWRSLLTLRSSQQLKQKTQMATL